MKKLLPFMLIFICCFGCVPKYKPGTSYIGALPETSAIQSIASDATTQLIAIYPPGHSEIYLLQPEKNNVFSQAFEDDLRAKGFVLLSRADNDAIQIEYTLDAVKNSDNQESTGWYLQLRLSDGRVFARSYGVTGSVEAGISKTGKE